MMDVPIIPVALLVTGRRFTYRLLCCGSCALPSVLWIKFLPRRYSTEASSLSGGRAVGKNSNFCCQREKRSLALSSCFCEETEIFSEMFLHVKWVKVNVVVEVLSVIDSQYLYAGDSQWSWAGGGDVTVRVTPPGTPRSVLPEPWPWTLTLTFEQGSGTSVLSVSWECR